LSESSSAFSHKSDPFELIHKLPTEVFLVFFGTAEPTPGHMETLR